MDPNYGAYLFEQKDDFLNFYDLVYDKRSRKGTQLNYKFYEIQQITYDENQTLIEPRSFAGKTRSLFSGTKYNNSSGSLLDALLTVSVMLAIPLVVATILGLLFGGLLATIGFLLIFCPAITLPLGANNSGYSGLLGIPDYLKERWYDYREGTKPTVPESSTSNARQECQEKTPLSTSSIFKSISVGSRQDNTNSYEYNLESSPCIPHTQLFKPYRSKQNRYNLLKLQ